MSLAWVWSEWLLQTSLKVMLGYHLVSDFIILMQNQHKGRHTVGRLNEVGPLQKLSCGLQSFHILNAYQMLGAEFHSHPFVLYQEHPWLDVVRCRRAWNSDPSTSGHTEWHQPHDY